MPSIHRRLYSPNRQQSSTSAGLIRRYGLAPESSDRLPGPRDPNDQDLRAFGPLVWIELLPFKGKMEFWDFAPNPNRVRPVDREHMPRVIYDNHEYQYWFVGGSFRVDERGFHRTMDGPCSLYGNKPCDLAAAKKKYRGAYEDYVEHHGGLEPDECTAGSLVYPDRVVCVGRCKAAAYLANRNNGKGLRNYRHEMAENYPKSERRAHMPFVDVSEDGCRIFLRGGDMKVDGGWMID